MDTAEFNQKWTAIDNNLKPVSTHFIANGLNLAKDVIDFLTNSGLPEDAAPFLSFYSDTAGKKNSIDILTKWFDFLEPAFRKYVVIGSDGSGDIIALNTENNCVVELLDHEDGFTPRFMNSSINQLAACLLMYKQFIQLITSQDKNAFLESSFTDLQFADLYNNLKSADQKVVLDGFWKNELDMLIANREDS